MLHIYTFTYIIMCFNSRFDAISCEEGKSVLVFLEECHESSGHTLQVLHLNTTITDYTSHMYVHTYILVTA